MLKPLITLVLLLSHVAYSEIQHTFLALDESRSQLHYVDQFQPDASWSISLPRGTRDLQWLNATNVLISTPDGFITYNIKTREKIDQYKLEAAGKVETIVPLKNGNIILGENSQQGIQFHEIGSNRQKIRSICFPNLKGLRLMRLSPEGNLLFGANNTLFIEANWKGEILTKITFAPKQGRHLYWGKKLDSKTFRISTGYGKSVVDIQKDGTVLRKLGGTENLLFFCRVNELGNGNILVSHWNGHQAEDSKKGAQLIEYNPAGEVVWSWHDPKRAGTIHSVLTLR